MIVFAELRCAQRWRVTTLRCVCFCTAQLGLLLLSGLLLSEPSVAQPTPTANSAASSWPAIVLPLKAYWPQALPIEALSVSVIRLPAHQYKNSAANTLWRYQDDQARAPASVMKLVTAYAALSLLGPNYRWQTELLTAGPVRNGALTTPLYIKASGDPSLSVAQLWEMLAQLRAQGIQHLAKGVVIDRSIYGQVATDPGAFDGAADRPYNASPDAFLVGMGASEVDLRFDTTAQRWQVSIDALPLGDLIDNQLQVLAGPCRTADSTHERLRILYRPAAHTWQVQGAMPAQCETSRQYRLLMSPAIQAQAQFQRLWTQLGGTLDQGFSDAAVPANAQSLVRHASEPLSDILKPILKYSNNVMARQVFLALSDTFPAEPAAVAANLPDRLAAQGLRLPNMILEGGAGLSRIERLSAQDLTHLLTAAWFQPWMPEFTAALPVWGQDGTLAKRTSASLQGKARFKTGSLDNVRSMAGYVPTASGEWLAVAILINHPDAKLAGPFVDALIDKLSELAPALP